MADRDSFEQTPYELPPGSTEIVLVRHGASDAAGESASTNPLVDGHSEPGACRGPGKAQAASWSRERLTGRADRRRSSSRPCAAPHETAAPLAAATGIEPVAISELREVFLGDFEGGEYRIRQGRGDPIIQQVFAERSAGTRSRTRRPSRSSAPALRAGVEADGRRGRARTRPRSPFVHGAVIGELCRQATDSRALRLRPRRQRLDLAARRLSPTAAGCSARSTTSPI